MGSEQDSAEEAEALEYNRWKGRVYAAEDMIKATDPRWGAAESACAAAGRALEEAVKTFNAAVQARDVLDSEILEQAKVAGGPRPPRPRHDTLRRQALNSEKKP